MNPMSRPILCDVCGQQSDPLKVIQVTGWWGKQLARKGTGKGKEALDEFEPVKRSDRENLVADVCGGCMESTFSAIQLQQIPTRQQHLNELLAKGISGLKALRLSAGPGYLVDGVRCDLCQADCYENHLRLKGASTEEYDSMAEVCESCANTHLHTVKFQREEQPLSKAQ
jgi:hypothetical protein